jgi:hypothetical protein
MAMPFPPTREADLVTASTNFKERIVAAPTLYALTEAQATEYATRHDTFVESYQAARDPSTRTPSQIIAKNTDKEALLTYLRELARIVQAAPNVTDEQKSILGLPVHNDEPTPIGAPTEPPVVVVCSMLGRNVKVRLQDLSSPTRRGKPLGVNGAAVFAYVGATPPADTSDWTFVGNTARTSFDVELPATMPAGATMWITAFWFNPRKQSGPAATPTSVGNPGGIAEAA